MGDEVLTQPISGCRVMPMQYDPGAQVIDVFGERAAITRKVQELSQQNVATKMRELGHDWHQTTVSKVESGQRSVSLREAYDLARVLERPLRDFLKGESSEHEQATLAYELAEVRL